MNPNAIPIVCADSHQHACPPTGCGACLSTSAGPVCRADVLGTEQAPRLEGPPELLRKLVAELDEVLAVQMPDGALGATSLVHSLSVGHGEAELTLAVASRCAGARLVDSAFQVLRRLLPDTDIYVTGAG